MCESGSTAGQSIQGSRRSALIPHHCNTAAAGSRGGFLRQNETVRPPQSGSRNIAPAPGPPRNADAAVARRQRR